MSQLRSEPIKRHVGALHRYINNRETQLLTNHSKLVCSSLLGLLAATACASEGPGSPEDEIATLTSAFSSLDIHGKLFDRFGGHHCVTRAGSVNHEWIDVRDAVTDFRSGCNLEAESVIKIGTGYVLTGTADERSTVGRSVLLGYLGTDSGRKRIEWLKVKRGDKYDYEVSVEDLDAKKVEYKTLTGSGKMTFSVDKNNIKFTYGSSSWSTAGFATASNEFIDVATWFSSPCLLTQGTSNPSKVSLFAGTDEKCIHDQNPDVASEVKVNSDWTFDIAAKGRSGYAMGLDLFAKNSNGSTSRDMNLNWRKVRRPGGGYGFLVMLKDRLNDNNLVQYLPQDGTLDVHVGKGSTTVSVGSHEASFDLGFQGITSTKTAKMYAFTSDNDLTDVCEARGPLQSSTQVQTGRGFDFIFGMNLDMDVGEGAPLTVSGTLDGNSQYGCEPLCKMRHPHTKNPDNLIAVVVECIGAEDTWTWAYWGDGIHDPNCDELHGRTVESLFPMSFTYDIVVGAKNAKNQCARYAGTSNVPVSSVYNPYDPDPNPNPPPDPGPGLADTLRICGETSLCPSGYYASDRGVTSNQLDCGTGGSTTCTEVIEQAWFDACNDFCPSGYRVSPDDVGATACSGRPSRRCTLL